MDLAKMEKVIKSKKKGIKFVDEAIDQLVVASQETKWLSNERKEATKKLKETLATIEQPYKNSLAVIEALSDQIRERVMAEYESNEPVRKEGVGELVFPMVQSIEIVDVEKVDRRYLTVDMAKVREDVKNGVMKIKGIRIGKKRTMQVRLWKEE